MDTITISLSIPAVISEEVFFSTIKHILLCRHICYIICPESLIQLKWILQFW